MGASNSHGAFSSMSEEREEQPLTPTPPRREIEVQDYSASQQFVSWTPSHGSLDLADQTSGSTQAVHEMFIGDSEEESVKPASLLKSPVFIARVSPSEKPQVDELGVTNECESDLHEHDLISAKPKTEDRSLSNKVNTPRSNKVKLTNLLRTLSASAPYSTSLMTSKSAASGDARLKVSMLDKPDEANEDENPVMRKIPTDEPSRSVVRKMFSLTSKRISATPNGTPRGRASLKYSPISSDE